MTSEAQNTPVSTPSGPSAGLEGQGATQETQDATEAARRVEHYAEVWDEWLFRMHGITSSCNHHDEARAVIAVADQEQAELRAEVERLRRAFPNATCRHCGDEGPALDDHTCPCPYADDACPDHPASEPLTRERLGENLRRAITASGLTQREVAERAEIDETALSKMLAGKRKVSSLELALVCTATGSDVLGILEADPLHGPSFRAGMEFKWEAAEARVAELEATVAKVRGRILNLEASGIRRFKRAKAAEGRADQLAKLADRVITVHEQVVMDTPEDRALHDEACAAFRGLLGAILDAPKDTTETPCPTCSGPSRETVGMVCQTCGTDYAPKDTTAP